MTRSNLCTNRSCEKKGLVVVLPSPLQNFVTKLKMQGKHWCFTLNNPTEDEQIDLATHGEEIDTANLFSYLIFGRETGESGTPHLQGYVVCVNRERITTLKTIPGFQRMHLEIRRGSAKQASDYCKKDGDFDEYGTYPVGTGNASEFAKLRDWIASQETTPSIRDVWDVFPTLAARYRSSVLECIALFGKKPTLVDGALRPWQHAANARVEAEAHPRHIYFYVDPEGNRGKSWLVRYWLSKRDRTQFMSIGKRDDLAYAVSCDTTLFVFDIPRGHMQFVQYGIFEQLKNRVVFSNKYMSQTKILESCPHVVVFCNEEPDMNALSNDRYKVINI